MIDLPPRACAVCGFLTHVREDGRYFHPGTDLYDHVVIPVPPEELPTHRARCDFCYAETTPWMVWSQPFASRDGITRFRGNWACCDTCVDFVRRKHWAALVRRVMEHGVTYATKAELLDIYNRLGAHMGDVVPMDLRRLSEGLP